MRDGICIEINEKSFVKNQLKNNRLKYAIYLFRCNKKIIYVGETGRGLYRCIDGLTCNKNQTAAYPWRNHRDIRNAKIELMILSVGLPSTMAIKKSSREVVEADVTSAIFTQTGSWPKKLTALKVHGGVTRSKTYNSSFQKIFSMIRNQQWV